MSYEVFDNVLSAEEHQQIYNNLINSNGWKFGHTSVKTHSLFNVSQPTFYFWNHELLGIDFFSVYFMDKIKNLTGKNLICDRIYANGQTTGQPGNWHVDSDKGFTFLYYPNLEWDLKYGGETLFYNGDVRVYKPNSGIFFPANLTHMGMEPSRHFTGLRMTIAFKLQEIKDN